MTGRSGEAPDGSPTAPRRRRGGALAVAGGILASRLSGFARAAVTSAAFGVGPHADVLQTALRAPNLLQNLLGEQVLSASFIPVYSRLLAAGRHDAARRFAGAVFGLLLAVAGGAALLGVLAARPLVALFAAGYLQDAAAVAAGQLSVDRFELAVAAVRWIFPMTGLLVLSAWALGVLNSHGRFFLAYVAPVVWNAAILAALAWGMLGGRRDDRLLLAACVGALLGGLLQFLVQLPAVRRELGGLPISFSRRTEGVGEALAAFGPAVAGRGVVQLSSYLDQLLASVLTVGAVSALGYAQLLYLLPVALFGQSIAASALPELARLAPGEDRSAVVAGLAARTRRALTHTGLLNLPTAAAYLCLGPVIAGALYRLLPGRFGAAESWLVGLVLGGYALGLPAATGSRVLQSSFYALSDTRTPARIAAIRVAVAALIGVPLMLGLDRLALSDLPGLPPLTTSLRVGAVGLALAASVAAWVEWGLLTRALRRQIPGFERQWGERLRVGAASLVAAAAGLAVARLTAAQPPILQALAAGATFAAAFLAAGLALGLRPLRDMRRRAGVHPPTEGGDG